MGCRLDQELIDKVVDFHGHWCPGLAIGLRAGEWALEEMGRAEDEDIVAVVETDMCAVDAIQALISCTFGKGNLIHLDYGKTAFSFYRYGDGKSARLVFALERPDSQPEEDRTDLVRKMAESRLSPEEEDLLKKFREEWSRLIMEADMVDVFQVQEATQPVPRKARIVSSLVCESCREQVMETRTHRLLGQTLCLPCFERLEKRL
jgi:formylmethanofuran dehydrogenase subunit E